MSKFSFKSLFIKEDEQAEKNDSEPVSQFPNSVPAVPSTKFPNKEANSSGPLSESANPALLGQIMDMYEKGFESLNKPGYDFFEFYKAVSAVDSENPQAYKMAFQMAKTMDSNVSKQKFLSEADFYLSEINKVHSTYKAQGESKLSQLAQARQAQEKSLQDEVANIALQIENLKRQIADLEQLKQQKTASLSPIQSQAKSDEMEVTQKMMANDMAREAILQKIMSAKLNIESHL